MGLNAREHADAMQDYIRQGTERALALPNRGPIVLDDATFGTLSSIILYNNVEILQALASDPGFFQNLFSKMRAADREGQDWANLVEFVRELCDHTKHLQVHQRHQLQSQFTVGRYSIRLTG